MSKQELYSNGKPPKNKKALVRNIVILVFSFIFLIGGGICLYADVLLGRIGYSSQEPEGPGLFQSTKPDASSTGVSSGALPAGELKMVNGLYHDDAVVNILLLGADDYQENDIGRTDSMMLVSVDTRHKKLKMTSFTRDTLVPGTSLGLSGAGSNGATVDRLNTAYTYAGGDEKGAAATVRAIEANYGIDIDRWVLIKDATFDAIVEKLGGVEITLTQTEADEINSHFHFTGSKKIQPGTQLLNAELTHYYSRIRHADSDFGRTGRQRNVLTSIINRFKKSDVITLSRMLYDVLPLVKTSMAKDDITTLLGSALDYLNYPLSETVVPMDGEYHFESVYLYSSGSYLQSVTVLDDWKATRMRLVEFIYEKTLAS